MNDYSPIDNKYHKWYLYFIYIFQKRDWTRKIIGSIKHHIDPKSFYLKCSPKNGWKTTDPDIKENLVYITNREHFVLHWLLCYCYSGVAKQKMVDAFHRMSNGNKSSRFYEFARKMKSENMIGERNHRFGTIGILGYRHTEQVKQHLYDINFGENNPMFGKIPWNKGLTKDTDIRVVNQAISQKGYKRTTQHSQNIANSNSHSWSIIDPKGQKIDFRNLTKFCRDTDLNMQTVWKMLTYKKGSHKGYTPP